MSAAAGRATARLIARASAKTGSAKAEPAFDSVYANTERSGVKVHTGKWSEPLQIESEM